MPYLVRRLAFYLVAAWVAITLNFFIPRAVPGNPAEIILSKYPDLTPSAFKALEQMIGGAVGTGSLWSQYLHSTSTPRPSPRFWTSRSRGR
jgi:peptide/nickel transport system permease protein